MPCCHKKDGIDGLVQNYHIAFDDAPEMIDLYSAIDMYKALLDKLSFPHYMHNKIITNATHIATTTSVLPHFGDKGFCRCQMWHIYFILKMDGFCCIAISIESSENCQFRD